MENFCCQTPWMIFGHGLKKFFIALTCVDGKSSRKVESGGNNFAVQSVAQHDKH